MKIRRRSRHSRRKLPISNINAAFGDSWPRIAAADSGAPKDGGAIRGEVLDDARLAPDGVPIRSKPLRPIIGQ